MYEGAVNSAFTYRLLKEDESPFLTFLIKHLELSLKIMSNIIKMVRYLIGTLFKFK